MDSKKLFALLKIVEVLQPMVGASTALIRAITAIRGTATAEEIQADLQWLKTDAAARKALSELALEGVIADALGN